MTQISQKKTALHKIRYKRFGGVKMSFCNTLKPDRTPGPISGNPLHNLCERACIQVRKVFDACINQTSLEDYGVTITNPTPANYTTPLTFVSAASTSSAGTISNLIVTPLSGDNPHNSRVQATITIPVEVIYVDANNVEGKGTAEIVVNEDVIMCFPDNSVIPVEIAATVNAVSPQGAWTEGLGFAITSCVTVVLKAEAEVELLVPSYGYCYIPPCQAYTQEVCTGVFDLPLFPTTFTR